MAKLHNVFVFNTRRYEWNYRSVILNKLRVTCGMNVIKLHDIDYLVQINSPR